MTEEQPMKCQMCGDWSIHSYSNYCPNCGFRIKDDREEAEVHKSYTRYACSGCGSFVGQEDSYCEECGRKLNWEPLMRGYA